MTDLEKLETILIKNKYSRIYLSICKNRKINILIPEKGKHHKHHILPKSFGGSNDSSNIVLLKHREHLIVHRCLIKCTSGQYRSKMVQAIWMLLHKEGLDIKINSRFYDYITTENRKTISTKKSIETRQKMSKPKSPEHIAKIRAATMEKLELHVSELTKHRYNWTGKKLSEEHKAAMRGPRPGRKPKTSLVWKIPLNDLIEATKNAKYFSDIIRKFMVLKNGAIIRDIKLRLIADNIDFSHIKQGCGNHGHD